MVNQASSPIAHAELEQLTIEVCEHVFGDAKSYDHDASERWNHEIIQSILQRLIKIDEGKPQRFKYIVTSTIIQHLESASPLNGVPDSSTSGSVAKDEQGGPVQNCSNHVDVNTVLPSSGRRGMHSATAAYWDNEKDGCWTYKWEGAHFETIVVITHILA